MTGSWAAWDEGRAHRFGGVLWPVAERMLSLSVGAWNQLAMEYQFTQQLLWLQDRSNSLMRPTADDYPARRHPWWLSDWC